MPAETNIPELKIDCFTIRIKRKKVRNSNEDDFLKFDDFFEIPSKDDEPVQVISFTDFFISYVNSFEGQFASNTKGKAIFLDMDNLVFKSEQRIISGIVEGGATDMGGAIKKHDNASDEDSFQFSKDHVQATKFYFLLWFPKESDLGILLFQSYSNKSVCDVYKRHLESFFRNKSMGNYSLLYGGVVPKQLVEEMKKESVINTITLRKNNLPSDKASRILGLKYSTQAGIKIELKVSGIKQISEMRERIENFMSGANTKLFDIPELEEIGFDEETETSFKLEHNGKQITAKSTNAFRIRPSFYIAEEDIVRNHDNIPEFASIDAYCLSFLTKLKNDIQ